MAADGVSVGGMATSGMAVAVAGAVYGGRFVAFYLYLPHFSGPPYAIFLSTSRWLSAVPLGSSTATRQFVTKLVDLPVVLLNRCAIVWKGSSVV